MTTSIYELFPSLDRGVVADVLHQCSNNVDQAIDMLLGMSLDSTTLASQPANKQHTPRTKTFAAKKQPGWSAVTAEERGIARPVSHYAPTARRAAELSDSHAFPALSAELLPAPQHSATQAADRSPWGSKDITHASNHSGPTEGNSCARKLDVGQSAGIAVTSLESSSKTEDTYSAPHGKGTDVKGANSIQSLRVLHPWADTALLQDVLQAAEGDVNAAAWMLSELHNPVTPGMSPQMSPSMSPWASPLGSPLGSPHISPARSHLPAHLSSPRPPDLATIAELAGQKARPAPNSKQRVQEPAKPAQTSDRAAKAGRLGNPRSRPEHTDSPSSERGRQRRQRSEEEGDAYYSFRGEALQLTRQWQRAAHKATSAFSGGSHSEARKFAREARHLREKALKAHAQAASRIEEANNVGKGHDSWTLDLHGLHGTEALDAVDRRVALLARLLASEAKRAGSLRVITGKGNHSSGGEGSLGRVIANHLAGQSVAHTVQGGAILVHIRAQDQGQRRH